MDTFISFSQELISAGSYLAIIVLMAVETVVIGLPSMAIMPFAGFLAAQGVFNFHLLNLAGALGSLLGNYVFYVLGYSGGRPALLKWGARWGLQSTDLARAEKYFQRYGVPIVFFSRLIPSLRSIISLPAGLARMHLVPFTIYTFLGNLLWCYLLSYLGYLLGENWESLIRYSSYFNALVILLLIGIIGWYIFRRYTRGKTKVK